MLKSILNKILDTIIEINPFNLNSNNQNSNNKLYNSVTNTNINGNINIYNSQSTYKNLENKNNITSCILKYFKYFVFVFYLCCFYFAIKKNFFMFLLYILLIFPLSTIFNKESDISLLLCIFLVLVIIFTPINLDTLLSHALNFLSQFIEILYNLFNYLKSIFTS